MSDTPDCPKCSYALSRCKCEAAKRWKETESEEKAGVSLSLTDEEVLEVAVRCEVFIDDPSDWMANDYKKERILIFAKELLLSALQGH